MLLLKVLVVILLTIADRCFSCSCGYLDYDENCYGHLTSCPPDFTFSSKDAVRWQLVQGSAGYLDVTFDFPTSCPYTCYQLDLYVDESMSREECQNSPQKMRMTEATRHSRRSFVALECARKISCPQNSTVRFQYVFTGCYRVEILPYVENNTRKKENSSTIYIESDYSKTLPATYNISISDQPRPKLHTCEIKFSVDDHVTVSSLTFYINSILRNMSTRCNDTLQNCLTCKIENGTVLCTFHNITPGHYCLTVNIKDDRCEGDTLWTWERGHICNFKYNFTYPEELYDPSDVRPGIPSRYYIIFGVVVAIVCFAILVCIIALRSFIIRAHPGKPSAKAPSNTIALEPCRIFLLYARDCQPFMEMMATLREVLEDATKSEVIDSLDASRWNEVGRSPVEWVRNYIEHPNTKVVLVATQCAYLHQQAHLNQLVTSYKEPVCYDNLFTLGLKTLTDNTSPDIYRKISVIRFEGFSDDANLFSHLTPYTRFVLPMHLHKLIYNLQPTSSPDENVQLEESKEVQKLYQDLTNLINFKNENINYLQDILAVQRKNS